MFALFNNHPPSPPHKMGADKDFEFDFELDLEQNQFESFELPEIFLGRYMHDFKVHKQNLPLNESSLTEHMQVNHTVIVDTLGKKCFLMALDRALIPAPKVPRFLDVC